MKITVPTAAVVEVGYRQHFGTDRIYFDSNRPNDYSPIRESKIHELKFGTAVVFDRDLKLARRAAGVAHIAFMGVLAVAGVPVLAVSKIAFDAFRSACDTLRGCGEAYVLLRDEVVEAAREVVG